MKRLLLLVAAAAAAGQAGAADIDAGRTKATVCSACHGINGVSVSSDIPNLAGQKLDYLTAQLKAFRAGTRQNPLMNAMAGQLNDEDIDNLAAYFNSQVDADLGTPSALQETIETTRVTFPADYQNEFTHYTTINFPDRKQFRRFYANDAALQAARDGEPLPDGSAFLVEVINARLDAENNPVTGEDGFFEEDKIVAYTAMEKQAGWGDGFPEELRNDGWNYAVFKSDRSRNEGVNQAKCLACHKPLAEDSYVFTLQPLTEKARTN